MNKNTRIAKELVKIAKSLVANDMDFVIHLNTVIKVQYLQNYNSVNEKKQRRHDIISFSTSLRETLDNDIVKIREFILRNLSEKLGTKHGMNIYQNNVKCELIPNKSQNETETYIGQIQIEATSSEYGIRCFIFDVQETSNAVSQIINLVNL